MGPSGCEPPNYFARQWKTGSCSGGSGTLLAPALGALLGQVLSASSAGLPIVGWAPERAAPRRGEEPATDDDHRIIGSMIMDSSTRHILDPERSRAALLAAFLAALPGGPGKTGSPARARAKHGKPTPGARGIQGLPAHSPIALSAYPPIRPSARPRIRLSAYPVTP